MKYLLLLGLCCNAAFACDAGMTCVSWLGIDQYTNNKPIDAALDVTYTLMHGIKGGPYAAVAAYNAKPSTARMNVVVPTPATGTCFVIAAAVPGSLVSSQSAEGCKPAVTQPPPLGAPTDGSITAPSNGSIIH